MNMDTNLLSVVVGVLALPIIIILLAKQLKKVKDMKAGRTDAGDGGSKE